VDRAKTFRSGIAAMCLLALAACSPAGESGGGGGGTGGAATGDVKFELYQKVTAFNPFNALNGGDQTISALQFQPLLTTQDGKFVPKLAEKWDLAPDATQVTFHLRDAKWSDGKPITAKDVVFTLEAQTDPKTKAVFAGPMKNIAGAAEYIAGTAQTISGVSAPDDRTVVIKLAKPNAGLLTDLTQVYVVPQHVYGTLKHEEFKGSDKFRTPSVGSGAYTFAKWISDDEVQFQANPNFWAKPKLKNVYAKVLTGDVALAQLQTGEVDIAEVPAVEVNNLKKDGKVNLVTASGDQATRNFVLASALGNGKLADKRVRQAILYAINRQAIVDSVLAGHGKVPETSVWAPGWAVPDDLKKYNYDPNKAKALLAEAGWKADTLVRLDIVPGQADRDAVMNIIAGQLQAVGMNAKVTPHQPTEVSKIVANNDFDLLNTFLAVPSTAEPSWINQRLMCDQKSPAGLNIFGYCNPDLDALLAEGVATTDQGKRKDIYQKANRIINEDVPGIFPLYIPDLNYGTTKRVKGFNATTTTPMVNAEDWSVTQ